MNYFSSVSFFVTLMNLLNIAIKNTKANTNRNFKTVAAIMVSCKFSASKRFEKLFVVCSKYRQIGVPSRAPDKNSHVHSHEKENNYYTTPKCLIQGYIDRVP